MTFRPHGRGLSGCAARGHSRLPGRSFPHAVFGAALMPMYARFVPSLSMAKSTGIRSSARAREDRVRQWPQLLTGVVGVHRTVATG